MGQDCGTRKVKVKQEATALGIKLSWSIESSLLFPFKVLSWPPEPNQRAIAS